VFNYLSPKKIRLHLPSLLHGLFAWNIQHTHCWIMHEETNFMQFLNNLRTFSYHHHYTNTPSSTQLMFFPSRDHRLQPQPLMNTIPPKTLTLIFFISEILLAHILVQSQEHRENAQFWIQNSHSMDINPTQSLHNNGYSISDLKI